MFAIQTLNSDLVIGSNGMLTARQPTLKRFSIMSMRCLYAPAIPGQIRRIPAYGFPACAVYIG